MDFLEPILKSKYLVIAEAFSKWLKVFKVNETNAKAAIKVLRTVKSHFGLPDMIVSKCYQEGS